MASFITVIDHIVTTLQNDSALSAYCTAKWGKALKVLKVYKRRIEISAEDLPVILITRPSVERIFLIGGAKELRHTVRLYCGFHQTDKTKALEEFIEFEEKIIDALLVDPMRDDNAIDTDPQASVNDEGEYHPVYFVALDLAILCQIN